MTDIIVTDSGFAPYQPASQPLLMGVDTVFSDDISALSAIGIIHIPFASAADGRGFSLARQLRNLGYQGQIFAIGSLVCDQYRHARQSGCDGFIITHKQAEKMPEPFWLEQAARVPISYQRKIYA